jgi:hypothetical protein
MVSPQGQLVVQDQSSTAVWSSLRAGNFSRKTQLTSDGLPELACSWSGPSPPQSLLVSPSGRFTAAVSEAGVLQVQDSTSGAVVWTPQGAVPGGAPASLCLRNTGALLLLGKSGERPRLPDGNGAAVTQHTRPRTAATLTVRLVLPPCREPAAVAGSLRAALVQGCRALHGAHYRPGAAACAGQQLQDVVDHTPGT